MAYSGLIRVMEFPCANAYGRITIANTGIDVSDASADAATMIVPSVLKIYQFGLYVMESLGSTLAGSVFLERAPSLLGTDVTLAEIDLDSADLKSGDGVSANQTASTGSEDIDAGDVIFAPASSFPITVIGPQYLTVRHAQSASVAGELAPFIVAKWMPPDLRSTEQWSDVT